MTAAVATVAAPAPMTYEYEEKKKRSKVTRKMPTDGPERKPSVSLQHTSMSRRVEVK